MRFASIAVTLSLAYAVGSSVAPAQEPQADPRAAVLIAQGEAALAAGKAQQAVDYFEAALVVDPGYTPIYLDLGRAARSDGLQGKAIAYYREALRRDPTNLAALSGEGSALVEKGAVGKAREKLAQLEQLCGSSCDATRELAAIIAQSPQPRILRAEAIMPEPEVSQN